MERLSRMLTITALLFSKELGVILNPLLFKAVLSPV